MGRSSWKFNFVTNCDLYKYYNKLSRPLEYTAYGYRDKTINNWNNNITYKVEQGKVHMFINTNEYFNNYKLGMFSKTRKPFFFRSKKKKNEANKFYFFI